MAGLFDQYEQASSGRADVTGGSASSQQLVTKTYSFIREFLLFKTIWLNL